MEEVTDDLKYNFSKQLKKYQQTHKVFLYTLDDCLSTS